MRLRSQPYRFLTQQNEGDGRQRKKRGIESNCSNKHRCGNLEGFASRLIKANHLSNLENSRV